MYLKAIVAGIAIIILSPLYASNFLKLSDKPLSVNQCPIVMTSNPLDLALTNSGYFVVSQGKKNSEKLFSRYGRFYLDSEHYMRTDIGHYLLKITKKTDPKSLSKIKISFRNLPPKATKNIKIEVNLPANASPGNLYQITSLIYDSLAIEHNLDFKFVRNDDNSWSVQVFEGTVNLDEGKLVFTNSGLLEKQEGLAHIQWPTNYGMHELKIDLSHSTQYTTGFEVTLMHQDGYGLGLLMAVDVNMNGEIRLLYSNGQSKLVKGRIAIAKFTNPGFLEFILSHLYRPTEKSGNPMIHWLNGEYSVVSGGLEEEPCFKS